LGLVQSTVLSILWPVKKQKVWVFKVKFWIPQFECPSHQSLLFSLYNLTCLIIEYVYGKAESKISKYKVFSSIFWIFKWILLSHLTRWILGDSWI
jgi:hypothetical protein